MDLHNKRSLIPALDPSALDQKLHAAIAQSGCSISFIALWLTYLDWAGHLSLSPGKRLNLVRLGLEQAQQFNEYCCSLISNSPDCVMTECIAPATQDRRFRDPDWHRWPFNFYHQSFLLFQEWWAAATHGISGVSRHHEEVVSFVARQLLDTISPGNYLLTNPVALRKTMATGGENLRQGMINFMEDIRRYNTDASIPGTENFVVGRDVAITPGKVVYRNALIELIQYTHTTEKVHPEPILIVPAWIMKYYILDLSPDNSLIRYLVNQGHTVFCISWKNPGEQDRNLSMDDYLHQGIYQAIAVINSIIPHTRIHATGYCIGGTLLAIAAAAMARDNDDRLASITLFAAQTDFSEPGELALFIDESEVSLLEAQMQETGFLSAGQMAGAFQILRSNDLFWSRLVEEYLMGERARMNDLMAWNADATRMPARMHGEYLRKLFLNNDLSSGKYTVTEKPVSLSDITIPIFCVATDADHVAPWKSVYKLHYLTSTEITFLLANGGHNAGIISEPGHPGRHYQVLTHHISDKHLAPDVWQQSVPECEGSWWMRWNHWLDQRSGSPVKPPNQGVPETQYQVLCDAPGTYVLEK